MDPPRPLLQFDGLRVVFDTDGGPVPAVDGLDLAVGAGEAVGLVGESGCGKSVAALAALRLLPEPPARVAGGRVVVAGRDVAGLSGAGLRRLRGGDVAMVFQEPMTALNPVFRIGAQIAEAVRAHRDAGRAAARAEAERLLGDVGIPDPAARARDYPHEFSGGMRQRAMLAMALAGDPALLIADEPTTALDVTVQAQILALLATLRRERGMALLLISHDLGVVAEVVDRVAVMYAGRCVEQAPSGALFATPRHPYTRALLRSRPSVAGEGAGRRGGARLASIPGAVPTGPARPPGCAFHPRCAHAVERCREELPALRPAGERQHAACHRLEELDGR